MHQWVESCVSRDQLCDISRGIAMGMFWSRTLAKFASLGQSAHAFRDFNVHIISVVDQIAKFV